MVITFFTILGKQSFSHLIACLNGRTAFEDDGSMTFQIRLIRAKLVNGIVIRPVQQASEYPHVP